MTPTNRSLKGPCKVKIDGKIELGRARTPSGKEEVLALMFLGIEQFQFSIYQHLNPIP